MLSSANGGKYVSESWHRDKIAAATDPTNFSTDELSYLEVDAATNTDENPEHFMVDSMPLDPETISLPNAFDIRKLNKMGGV